MLEKNNSTCKFLVKVEVSKEGQNQYLIQDWLNDEVSKAILGNTLTTNEIGTYAQAKIEQEIQEDTEKKLYFEATMKYPFKIFR